MAVKFFFNQVSIPLNQRRHLKQFIVKLFLLEGKQLASLNYIFCGDEYLLGINTEFLAHDDYTDIITFTLSSPSEPTEGEVYISVDRVKSNAASIGVNIDKELHRVIFHGALHLCGYNDKTVVDKDAMTALEDKYLTMYFSE
ncbi:MAG: ybeY [Ferruginibacter sp.]|nr:ybeY [Ferruginibacter sp.]